LAEPERYGEDDEIREHLAADRVRHEEAPHKGGREAERDERTYQLIEGGDAQPMPFRIRVRQREIRAH
jgi:hypothetical protein